MARPTNPTNPTDHTIDRLRAAIWALSTRIESGATYALQPAVEDRLVVFDAMTTDAQDILALTAAARSWRAAPSFWAEADRTTGLRFVRKRQCPRGPRHDAAAATPRTAPPTAGLQPVGSAIGAPAPS